MTNKTPRILVLNPGSTSTKLALYEGETPLMEKTVRHGADDFAACPTVMEQKSVRLKYLEAALAEYGFDPAALSAVVGRGGVVRPVASGTYAVNGAMLRDLTSGKAATHASSLGGIIAHEFGSKYGIPAFVVDPVVVDELSPQARLTGIPEIQRRSVFHALNTKAVARRCAERLGKRYEDARFVVAHMGGGITVGAHLCGRVVDVNDGLAGEGPFTPERCGAVPLEMVVELCFSGKYGQQEMLDFCHKRGGMAAHLGTNDMRQVEERIRQGDEQAALVLETMAYQVAKEVGAMAAALQGKADALIFTGGLAYSELFIAAIGKYVEHFAPVMVVPGEFEMDALALGALRVLGGEEEALEYVGAE